MVSGMSYYSGKIKVQEWIMCFDGYIGMEWVSILNNNKKLSEEKFNLIADRLPELDMYNRYKLVQSRVIKG